MGNSSKKNTQEEGNRTVLGQFLNRFFPDINLASNARSIGTLVPCSKHVGDCVVCMEPATVMLLLSSCSHMACAKCWLRFFCTGLESFAMARLTCVSCKLSPDSGSIVNLFARAIAKPADFDINADDADLSNARLTHLLARYEEFLLRKALSREPDVRWCPRGCGYALIANDYAACPEIVCMHPNCQGRSFCYHCQRPWFADDNTVGASASIPHTCVPIEADEASSEAVEGVLAFLGFRPKLRRSSAATDSFSPRASTSHVSSPLMREISVTTSEKADYEVLGENLQDNRIPLVDEAVKLKEADEEAEESESRSTRSSVASSTSTVGEVKPCPNCQSLIEKVHDGSCNSMVCAVCGHNFCWLCMQPVTAGHYISLSGCFIYGRERWSKKRRLEILATLLLTAPVVIPLMGIRAIPGIAIGMTNFAVNRTLRRLQNKGKSLRGFAAVLASIGGFLSGLCLGGLYVAILVPVLFGYVYLYIPITALCSLNQKIPETPVVKFTDSQERVDTE